MNNILILLTMCICLACNAKKKEFNIKKEMVEVGKRWQQDVDGCLKIRSKKLAQSIIKDYNLNGKSVQYFLKIFGSANCIKYLDNKVILIYYFDSVCKENNPVKNGDKCYAKFYFENNKFYKDIYLCE